MLPTDDPDSLLAPAEILEAVAAIGTRDRFEVAYTLYALDVDAATVGDLAAETSLSEPAVGSHVETLIDAGVLTERMPCLVDPSVDGAEYELTEFGRLLLEEGVLALFEAAEGVDEVEFGSL